MSLSGISSKKVGGGGAEEGTRLVHTKGCLVQTRHGA
jgi:hypothetical protein